MNVQLEYIDPDLLRVILLNSNACYTEFLLLQYIVVIAKPSRNIMPGKTPPKCSHDCSIRIYQFIFLEQQEFNNELTNFNLQFEYIDPIYVSCPTTQLFQPLAGC